MKAAGESSFNHLYFQYKKNAGYRNMTFELTKEQFRELVDSPCCYCGREKSMAHKRLISNGAYLCNGVDRANNALGYTAGNSVPCCTSCNFMKKCLSATDFVNACKAVADYQAAIGF
jgi:hypothetical protein